MDNALQPCLEAVGLSKRYGRKPVLEDLNFSLLPGQVYALVGPNGSGKTTLIRLLTGLAFPSAGTVRMMGQDLFAGGQGARRLLGAVVEAPAAFYPHLSGRQNLEMHAFLAGIATPESKIREVLGRLELLGVADQKVGAYSLGQRQRLGLAAAILGEPQVLVLDEPTSGLDPIGIVKVHEVLTDMATRGVAVFLSTHHLREVAAYATRVGILGSGRLLEEVRLATQQERWRLRVNEPDKAVAFLKTVPSVQHAQLQTGAVVFSGTVEPTLAALIREGFLVTGLERDLFDLYDYYRERIRRA